MEIIAGKKYVTRDGGIALIEDIAHNGKCYPITGRLGDTEMNWTREGRYYFNEEAQEESDYDLVGPYAAIPEPFVMDARATMAMHLAAAFVSGAGNRDLDASSLQIIMQDSAWMADALIAELAKGKTE